MPLNKKKKKNETEIILILKFDIYFEIKYYLTMFI